MGGGHALPELVPCSRARIRKIEIAGKAPTLLAHECRGTVLFDRYGFALGGEHLSQYLRETLCRVIPHAKQCRHIIAIAESARRQNGPRRLRPVSSRA